MTSFQPDHHHLAGSRPTPQSPPREFMRSLNILVGAMAGALVILGVVLIVIGAELATPEIWMLALVVAATVLAWGALLVLPRGRGQASPRLALQATVMLRVAVLEAPAILGFALAFVATPVNLLLYAPPAAFALLGIWLFARPGHVLNQVSGAA